MFSSWPGVPARAVEQRPLAPTGAPEILGPRRAARWEKYEFGRPRVGIAWGSTEASRRLVATGGASRGSLPNRDLAWCGRRDRHGAVVASRALAPASPAPFELPHRLATFGAASGEIGAKEEHSPRGNRSGSTPDTALIPRATGLSGSYLRPRRGADSRRLGSKRASPAEARAALSPGGRDRRWAPHTPESE